MLDKFRSFFSSNKAEKVDILQNKAKEAAISSWENDEIRNRQGYKVIRSENGMPLELTKNLEDEKLLNISVGGKKLTVELAKAYQLDYLQPKLLEADPSLRSWVFVCIPRLSYQDTQGETSFHVVAGFKLE